MSDQTPLDLESRLSFANRDLHKARAISGLMIILIHTLVWVILVGLVDLLVPLPVFIRILLLIGLVAFLVWSIWFRLIIHFLRPATNLDMALLLEQKYPQLEDRLITAVQVGKIKTKDVIQHKIWTLLAKDAEDATATLDFRSAIDLKYRNRVIFSALGLLMVLGLVVQHFPKQMEISEHRLFTPWKQLLPVLATRFIVEPGDVRLLRGNSLPLIIRTTGRQPKSVIATFQNLNRTESKVRDSQLSQLEVSLYQKSQNQFVYERFNLQSNFRYHLSSNGRQSPVYTVQVFDPPVVMMVEVDYEYPTYTSFKPTTQYNNGNLEGIVGTVATVRLTANKGISTATVKFNQDEPIPIKIVDSNILQFQYRLQLSDQIYKISLQCVDGFTNQEPIVYQIRPNLDKKPIIEITDPKRDLRLTQLSDVQIKANINDDFGLQSVQFLYQMGSGSPIILEPNLDGKPTYKNEQNENRLQQKIYTFYLEELDLSTGDIITYSISALDTGNQRVQSDIYFIEIKPLNEKYQKIESKLSDPNDSPTIQSLVILAEGQKNLIRRTWKSLSDNLQLEKSAQSISTTQQQLQQKTQQLVEKIRMLMATLSVKPEILILLEQSIEQMGLAIDQLVNNRPRLALIPEQVALEYLVKSTTKLEKILTQIKPGKKQQFAEDFELEMDQLQSQLEKSQLDDDFRRQQRLQALMVSVRQNRQKQATLTESYQHLVQLVINTTSNEPTNIGRISQRQRKIAQQTQNLSDQGQFLSHLGLDREIDQPLGATLKLAAKFQSQAAQALSEKKIQTANAYGQKAEDQLKRVERKLKRMQIQQTQQALELVKSQIDWMIKRQRQLQTKTISLIQEQNRDDDTRSKPNSRNSQKATELARSQGHIKKKLQEIKQNLFNLQKYLESKGRSEAAQSVAKTSERISQDDVEKMMSEVQISLHHKEFDNAQRDQNRIVSSMRVATEHLFYAGEKMAQTDEEHLANTIDQLGQWEDQLRDTQMTDLPNDLIKQMESMSHYSWLSEKSGQLLLDTLNSSYQKQPDQSCYNFDFAIDNIRQMKQLLILRLTKIKRQEQLSQLPVSRVASVYRRSINQYYEEIAQ